jgi:hypothetical protein
MIPKFGFRDPTTPYLAPSSSDGAEELCWHVVIGSGSVDGRRAAGLLYRSQSATDVTSGWTFVSVLLAEDAGAQFEQYQYSCPDFFPLKQSGTGQVAWIWMSLFPAWSNGAAEDADIYYVGRFDTATQAFVPSAGTPFSSPAHTPTSRFGHMIAKSGADDRGRRLLWGAVCGLPASGIPNPRSTFPGASPTHNGCTMSLGLEVTLDPTYRHDSAQHALPLRFRFLDELHSLRIASTGSYSKQHVPSGTHLPGGRLLEVNATFGRTPSDEAVGLDVFGGLVSLRYNPRTDEFYIAGSATQPASASAAQLRLREGAAASPLGNGTRRAGDGHVATHLRLGASEVLSMHVYVDGSIVEVIANERAPVAAIVLPPPNADLSIVAVGAAIETLSVWQLKPSVRF